MVSNSINVIIVYDLIGLHPEHEEYGVYNDISRNAIKQSIINADYIITISQSIKNEIIDKFGISDNRIIVITPAVDLNLYHHTDKT
ncbi:MAG: glycosyltransferase [Candidatus Micrarchaeaceae archaeon]